MLITKCFPFQESIKKVTNYSVSAFQDIHFPLLLKMFQKKVTVTEHLSNGLTILTTFYPESTSSVFTQCCYFLVHKSSMCFQALRKLKQFCISHWRALLTLQNLYDGQCGTGWQNTTCPWIQVHLLIVLHVVESEGNIFSLVSWHHLSW